MDASQSTGLASWLLIGGLAAGCTLLWAAWLRFRTRRLQMAEAPEEGFASALVQYATAAGPSREHDALRSAQPAERRSPMGKPERPDPPPASRTPSALLAEDDDVNALILTRQLEMLGLRVTRVGTGADAVALAAERPFDIVLLDWHMPELDGLRAIRLLRRQPGLRAMPIVVVTANSHADDRATCLEAGADAFLTKPVETEDLRIALNDLSILAVPADPVASQD